MPRISFRFEKRCAGIVCGIDEAGRGPLAGPVTAAAVILDPDCRPRGLNDSKLLDGEQRTKLYRKLIDVAAIGIGHASIEEIDRLNILQANMLAMRRAVVALQLPPDHALVDGNYARGLPCPFTTVIGGDALSYSIAAASIVAKVTRDRIMADLAADYPGYGWATNKGYSTPEHLAALERLGPTPMHRKSFAPVRRLLPESTINPLIQENLLTRLGL